MKKLPIDMSFIKDSKKFFPLSFSFEFIIIYL